ncbi:MAG: DUF3836 domain-containing protein [Prevotella sp.]|jgi:hypothetical protein|nr:DUF3836 domain-containing protein [Prevotella sp.]
MKAIILASVFASLVFAVNLNARNVKVYSNVVNSESGVKKEYVAVDNETLEPVTKKNYVYASDGRILERSVDEWSETDGWRNVNKHVYIYGDTDKVTHITYTKWNKQANAWADKSGCLIYIYDKDDELLAIERVEIDNKKNNFITQR